MVGKLVRAVRKDGQEYADEPSFATFSRPARKIDDFPLRGDSGEYGLSDELTADGVVLAPGAVFLPVAIYK